MTTAKPSAGDDPMVQALHAGISRRNWDDVEQAANRIRDNWRPTPQAAIWRESLSEPKPSAGELLPCPFCGGSADFERRGNHRVSTIVRCDECGCYLESGNEFNHGAPWNHRSIPAQAGAKLVEWQDIAETLCGVDGNGFLEDCSVTMQEAYRIRAQAVAILVSPPSVDETGVLQDDLKQMLQALGMDDGAQPRSPHEVFQRALVEMKKQLSAQAGADAVREALFEPDTANATDNLEGALCDIERYREQGKPADDICVRTIRRVIGQLAKAEAALIEQPARETGND